jgi:UDP-glucuronate decarboxylase
MAFDWSGKRVLVTGGAGFIGSHLCERLLTENAEVLCVDNYFTGRRTNIAHLLGISIAAAHGKVRPAHARTTAVRQYLRDHLK